MGLKRLFRFTRRRNLAWQQMTSYPAATVQRVLPSHVDEKKLVLSWSDNTVTSFPYVYLLDNQPGTKGRQVDSTELASEVQPQNIALSPNGHITVRWNNDKQSMYPISWLAERRHGTTNCMGGLSVKRKYWDAESFHERPKYDLGRLQTDDWYLLDMLLQLQSSGFAILINCGTSNETRMELAKLVDGGIRPTHYSG